MSQTDSSASSGTYTPEEFITKLRNALRADGDFPASAKMVTELRHLTQNPKTSGSQLTEIILKEPSLGTRVLSLVNSSFYRRRKPIMTISQAVVQIGMKPLSELCAGLILLQRFVPTARRSGPFANCLKKSVVTSLLASSLSRGAIGTKSTQSDETGYLAGSFAELGTLLLAYYFPKVYEAAMKRSEQKKQDLGKSISELAGLSPLQISKEILSSLELPDFYRKVLEASEHQHSFAATGLVGEQAQIADMAKSIFAAREISEVLSNNKGKPELDRAMARVNHALGVKGDLINEVVGNLPSLFKEHCSSIEIDLPPLPPYVQLMATSIGTPDDAATEGPDLANQFMSFVDEIRQAVENREPTASIITTVMETFVWSLGFDRVLLLLADGQKKHLVGRMMLGQSQNFDPSQCKRAVGPEAGTSAPDAVAFREARPVFAGQAILKDGWPFAVIPVGFGPRAIGVIYADKISGSKPDLDAKEQAAIGVLAELLDRSLGLAGKA